MKKIVPSAAAALVFVLITLLYYRIAAAMSNRFFQSELSTDMWVAIGFLFLYLIVILPLSIAAFTKIRAALTRRSSRSAAAFSLLASSIRSSACACARNFSEMACAWALASARIRSISACVSAPMRWVILSIPFTVRHRLSVVVPWSPDHRAFISSRMDASRDRIA